MKRFLFILSTFIFIFIFSNNISIVNSGTYEHTIYSPFENVLFQESKDFDTRALKKRKDILQTNLLTTFDQISNDTYEPDSTFAASSKSTEPYCRIGGWYMIRVKVLGTGRQDHHKVHELYYCKTTKDMLKKIKIPSDWINDELLLYCNDGSNINLPTISTDILTVNLKTYKACILKNQDLEFNNTILYGFESGNKIIDSNVGYYFNGGDLSNSITSVFKDTAIAPELITESNEIRYFDKKGKLIYLVYDEEDTFYSFKDFNMALDTDLMENVFYFSDIDDFDLSRVALFRSFTNENSYKVYGYETALRLLLDYDEDFNIITPVYRINLHGFDFEKDYCLNALKSYDSTQINFAEDQKVNCKGDDKVWINANNFDNSDELKLTSFNLFKNILLSAKP